jgi:Immunity protein 22
MSKLHIWLGNFASDKDLERYLDQKKYLEAWAVYDNEPPTGNEEEDAEPSPELRCDFCKEVDLDTYDEDFMIMKYYKKKCEYSGCLC